LQYGTIDTHDLMAAHRVIPEFAVEVDYVRFNPNQRWYWFNAKLGYVQ